MNKDNVILIDIDPDTMECYSALKKKEILPFVTTWMNLESTMLSQTEKDRHYLLSLVELTESRIVVARSWDVGEIGWNSQTFNCVIRSEYLIYNMVTIVDNIVSVQFSSVVQLCLTLCDPMDCSTPGFPVHHQLPEITQTHVHWVGDAIQPSHPLSPFSSRLQSFPASGCFQMSQFFASGGQSIGVSASVSVLPMNIQDWFPSGWTGWISLQSKGLSRVFSNTTVQKHQFFGAQLSL